MKRIKFILAIILLTTGIASAQQKGASIAVVGDEVHDFGVVKEANGPAVHTFTIKNEGNIALNVSRVTTSCGCTVPEFSKEPIAPGKTGEIKVSFDTANRPGPFTKTISVFSDGKVGSYMLTIKGTVEPKG